MWLVSSPEISVASFLPFSYSCLSWLSSVLLFLTSLSLSDPLLCPFIEAQSPLGGGRWWAFHHQAFEAGNGVPFLCLLGAGCQAGVERVKEERVGDREGRRPLPRFQSFLAGSPGNAVSPLLKTSPFSGAGSLFLWMFCCQWSLSHWAILRIPLAIKCSSLACVHPPAGEAAVCQGINKHPSRAKPSQGSSRPSYFYLANKGLFLLIVRKPKGNKCIGRLLHSYLHHSSVLSVPLLFYMFSPTSRKKVCMESCRLNDREWGPNVLHWKWAYHWVFAAKNVDVGWYLRKEGTWLQSFLNHRSATWALRERHYWLCSVVFNMSCHCNWLLALHWPASVGLAPGPMRLSSTCKMIRVHWDAL